jgi:hypothetical protein
MPRLREPNGGQSKVERAIAKRLGGVTPTQARGPGRRFKKGFKSGGRKAGTRNHLTTEVKTAIVTGLSRLGNRLGGNGLTSYCEWLGEDRVVGTALLKAVLPFEANVRTTVEQVMTLEQLDASLVAKGLPPSAELFARPVFEPDWRGTPDPEANEAEVVMTKDNNQI